MPTSYASVAQLKERVAVASTAVTSDGWLQQLLDAAAVLVDDRTRGYRAGWEAFAATTSAARVFDDNVYNGYVLIDDVQAVTQVKRDGVIVPVGQYKLWPYNVDNGPYERLYWSVSAFASVGGSVFYGSPWQHTGAGTIEVTGTWGYCSIENIPACVTEATLRQAELWYESAQLGPAQLGQMLVNPFGSLRADIAAILKPVMRSVTVG